MAAVTPDLILGEQPVAGSPTPLVFGASDYVVPSIQVAVDITLGGVTVEAIVAPPVRAEVDFTLGGVDVEALCFYDNRVTRYLDCRVLSGMGSGVAGESDVTNPWGVSDPKLGGIAQPWQTADNSRTEPVAGHEVSTPRRATAAASWQDADTRTMDAATSTQTGIRQATRRDHTWSVTDKGASVFDASNQTGILRQIVEVAQHQAGRPAVLTLGGTVGASLFYKGISFFTAPWESAGAPPPGTRAGPPVIPPDGKWWWDANLLFQCPPLAAPMLVFGGNTPCDPDTPPIQATVVVPVRSVYMVINDASLRRVDGNIQLPALRMSLALDVDSWTWRLTASLPGNTLAYLEPASDGAKVEVEATINGVAYRALVEGIGRDREFAKDDIAIQCRGLSSILDSPTSPTLQFFNSSARTAQQLMNDVLTVNGVSMGWTVNWGLEDWLVPAKVFSHQGSYINAVNAIAAAAGGYVQPHPSLQQINVLPRYPVAPWNWGTVTPDFELPSDVTTKEGTNWEEKARYNRVYVSGQQQGVLGQVTRAGTDGAILAPMVTDPLITTAAAARQRGLAILSDTGRQAELSLRLPVLSETGIILPGKFVRYVDGGTSRVGLVRSTAVDVGMPEIWQTLGVETHA